MRTLLYVPIVHALCESGGRGGPYIHSIELLLGSVGAARHLDAIDEFWRIIPGLIVDHVQASGMPWSRVHIFVDSIPRPLAGNPDGLVASWITRFMAVGSPMARLALDLIERGATLHGTEDDVLVERHGTHLLEVVGEEAAKEHYRTSQRYIALRDTFVAMHLDQGIPNNHMAILFMGALHNVDANLMVTGTFRIERIDLIDGNLLPLSHPLP